MNEKQLSELRTIINEMTYLHMSAVNHYLCCSHCYPEKPDLNKLIDLASSIASLVEEKKLNKKRNNLKTIDKIKLLNEVKRNVFSEEEFNRKYIDFKDMLHWIKHYLYDEYALETYLNAFAQRIRKEQRQEQLEALEILKGKQ